MRAPARRAWLSWGAAQLFFVLSVLVTVSLAIASPALVQHLGLGDGQWGQLGGAYFGAFSLAMLVFGSLLSTLSPRLLLGGTASLAALGALLLGSASSWPMALLAMVLMGIGLSIAFLGVVTVVGWEFPASYAAMTALSNAITNLCSCALALVSSVLPILTDASMAFRVLALLLLLAAALLVLVLPRAPRIRERSSDGAALPSLGIAGLPAAVLTIGRSSQFWLVALYVAGLFGAFLAYADLWNIPFQMRVFGHTINQAARLNAAFPLGVVLGSLVGGAWARRSGFLLPVRGFALLTLGVLVVLLQLPLNATAAALAFLLVGFSCSAGPLALAALPQHLPSSLVPVATTLVMTLAYLVSAGVQLMAAWPGGSSGIDDFQHYQASLGVIALPMAIAAAAAWFIRRGSRAVGPLHP